MPMRYGDKITKFYAILQINSVNLSTEHPFYGANGLKTLSFLSRVLVTP
jgi:hypothetical protein